MFPHGMKACRKKIAVCATATALSAMSLAASAPAGPDASADAIKTATPIKHVIIIVGENRSFDHLFATYVPKTQARRVLNLLSERHHQRRWHARARISPRRISSRSSPRPMAASSSAARTCKDKTALHHAAGARCGRRRRGLSLRGNPEHPGRRSGLAARGSIPLRHRRHGLELHARVRTRASPMSTTCRRDRSR